MLHAPVLWIFFQNLLEIRACNKHSRMWRHRDKRHALRISSATASPHFSHLMFS